jgi:nucleotide-binding universal stress UspA family protein
MSDTRAVLVPVEILEGETVSPGLVNFLDGLAVHLLGYHVVPEQTPPGQARMSFEARAEEKLEDVADLFRDAGVDVVTRLVFTQDEKQTLERVADEEGCDVVVHVNPAPAVEDVLVPLFGDANAERVAEFLADLPAADVRFHFLDLRRGEEDASRIEAARTRLRELDVDYHRVTGESVQSSTPVDAILTHSEGYDAVVMAEPRPAVLELLFGEVEARIAAGFVGPVLVVRRDVVDAAGADETDATGD